MTTIWAPAECFQHCMAAVSVFHTFWVPLERWGYKLLCCPSVSYKLFCCSGWNSHLSSLLDVGSLISDFFFTSPAIEQLVGLWICATTMVEWLWRLELESINAHSRVRLLTQHWGWNGLSLFTLSLKRIKGNFTAYGNSQHSKHKNMCHVTTCTNGHEDTENIQR